MSAVGMMEGAFFVSRTELLTWANGFFCMSLTKVEQCANGAFYCQVIDACHMGSVAMKRVNWGASTDHQMIPNYKVLQQAFDKSGIQRHVDVDKLVRGKYQDNLEMLQWIKAYFDRTYAGDEYDPVSRRPSDKLPDWALPGDATDSAPPPQRTAVQRSAQPRPASGGGAAPSRTSTGSSTGGTAARASRDGARPPASAAQQVPRGSAVPAGEHERLKDEYENLRDEIVDLKITVDGLETERDFYFQKLRDVEILAQALEAMPDPNMTVNKFVEDVQRILYAKDEEREEEEPDGGGPK